MRIAFTTLGCKINQYETDQLRNELSTQGNLIVPFDEQADVYIVNTCTVTAKSDYQCRQLVRAAAKRGNGAQVIVTGCYASTRPEELRNIPGVKWVVGNAEKQQIASRIMDQAGSGRLEVPVPDAGAGKRTRGFLKIQDGCDNRCSYCIVPDARGRSRSVPAEEVIRQFDRMTSEGCPEIVVTGIHVGMYGTDRGSGDGLDRLISGLVQRRGSSRIRLSSIEPNEITDDLLAVVGKGVCRHLHIPLQSGDDKILSAMRRTYTSSFYKDLVERIAGQVPDIAIGADVIVGFPGEGDRQFQNTYELVEKSPLTHLHVFSYSPRPGTPAAAMPDQVPEPVKKRRSEMLRNLAAEKNLSFRAKFVNRTLPVVVENKADAISGILSGFTDNYIRVRVSGVKIDEIGKEILVRIDEVSEKCTLGNLIVCH